MAPYLPQKNEEATTNETCNDERSPPLTSPELKWEELGFTLTQTDFMYVMQCSIGETFTQGSITPYRNIELNPASTLLNYGQGLFEGLKAYRREDGKVQIFRPELNALRMKAGAERLCMPSPSVEQFINAVKTTVSANLRWVPPSGKGSMYVRPLLMGTGASLGLGPSPEYMFLVYASPVSNYFKASKPLRFTVEEKHHRAMMGGTGGVKTVGNYSPVLNALSRAKAEGFSDVLFLDAETGMYVEEASACNIFMVKGNVISTPPTTQGTILPGITRKSIIELALITGYKVEERRVPLNDLLDADEVFCTGTAVVVTPVGSVTYKAREVEFKAEGETVCKKLHDMLTGIQTGRIEDKLGWMVEVI